MKNNLIQPSDLKPFQQRAASSLAEMIQEYPSSRFRPRYDTESGDMLPFLCRLRAITGAGKTPILAMAAQHLGTGIILWTTNRGAVISQTLSNLRAGGKYSPLLPEGTRIFLLGDMTPSEWTETMDATSGLTILLSTVAAFNQDGDNLKIHQRYGEDTRWEMLGGKQPAGRTRSLFIFYDEGHGATERQFQKLRELKPRAFVLASASPLPDDLADLVSGRTQEERRESLNERTAFVPTREVVQEGLLKSRLYFIDCNTAKADAIKEANDKRVELSSKLALFNKTPISCFIVNETSRGVDIWEHLVQLGVPASKIAVHLNGAEDVVYDRRGSSAGLIDTYTGRKPSERSPEALASGGYTHIIWNLTLREGWDEPFAYIAYIDDKGRSPTDIIQKIGRFVRQPNAVPFSDPDLNSAYFYFNVTDQVFARLIEQTQEEMGGDGYEVIPIGNGKRNPSSRSVPVRTAKSLPKIAPWFGDSVTDLDNIVLDNVPLFAESALRSQGSINTRVFDVARLKEDQSLRSQSQRAANDTISPWEYLSLRLSAIDTRIVNDNGTIFSAHLKDHEKLRQPMQFGSDAMNQLAKYIEPIKQQLNEKFQLRSLGRHGIFHVQPFKLVSPDVDGGSESYREKYKVRAFDNALHAEYNGFNPFELEVAEVLDATGKPWCRNPVGADGYRIPVQELGAETIWFYPDFLFWSSDSEVWALDPKGRHLLEGAIPPKLLDLSGLKGMKPSLRVAFILQGSFAINQQGLISRTGNDGYTLIRKQGTTPKAVLSTSLAKLLQILS